MPKTVLKFEVKNKTDTSVDMYIYGDIVSDHNGWFSSESDVAPTDIIEALKDCKEKDINLYINSCGGSVFSGISIYNIFKRHNGNVTVHIDGIAASIASVIAFCGNKVIMPTNSILMIHNAWSWGSGNSNDFRKLADDLDKCNESICTVYQDHLKDGVDIETIKQLMDEETWLSAEEASKYFDVEIEEVEEEAVAKIDLEMISNFKNVPKNIKEMLENKKIEETIENDEEVSKNNTENVKNDMEKIKDELNKRLEKMNMKMKLAQTSAFLFEKNN